MTRERRQQQRRQRNIERQAARRTGRAPVGYAAPGAVEFGGPMGWMQRNTKWLFLAGIVVLVVSLGAGTIFSIAAPTPTPMPSPSVTPSATASATSTATPTATADPAIRRSYPAAPPMTIDPAKKYEAIIHLKQGDVRVQLMPDKAPAYVNNFVFLARNRFFDGLTFHRVLPGFVAQGGDPLGTGFGGPGYTLPWAPNDIRFEPGVIAMAATAARGPASGSQFFITLSGAPNVVALQGDYVPFGRVTEGMDVLQKVTPRQPGTGQPPADIIERIEIVEKD